MVEGKGAGQEQEVDYEFFRAGVDGRKEGQEATDKRPGELSLQKPDIYDNSHFCVLQPWLGAFWGQQVWRTWQGSSKISQRT